MNFIFGKALLSLLFYTNNPYFFTPIIPTFSLLFPNFYPYFFPTFLLMGTWKPALSQAGLENSTCWLAMYLVLQAVIHLQFWAYGSWDSLFPISMSPTANLWVQNTIFNDKSAIRLHPGTRWINNFASQRQNYVQKMQDAQVTKSLLQDE